VEAFVQAAIWQANHTRGTTSREVMFTMGTDFQFENAFEWFSNMDKIIKVRYSSLSSSHPP
jgi:hypothetical protein